MASDDRLAAQWSGAHGARAAECQAIRGGGRRTIRAAPAALSVCLLVACADALPRRAPEGPVAEEIRQSEIVAEQCSKSAEAARIERERAEQLLSEARALAARAEDAERQCNATLRRVAESEKNIQLKFKHAAAKRAAAKKAEEAAPTPSPTPVKPQYSPSDAP